MIYISLLNIKPSFFKIQSIMYPHTNACTHLQLLLLSQTACFYANRMDILLYLGLLRQYFMCWIVGWVAEHSGLTTTETELLHGKDLPDWLYTFLIFVPSGVCSKLKFLYQFCMQAKRTEFDEKKNGRTQSFPPYNTTTENILCKLNTSALL